MTGPAGGTQTFSTPAGLVRGVPQTWRTHPFLAAHTDDYSAGLSWGNDTALVLNVPSSVPGKRALVGVGPAPQLAEAFASGFDSSGLPLPGTALAGADLAVVSLTRGAWDLLPQGLRGHLALPQVAQWDWMVTRQEPPHRPGEEAVIEADLDGAYDELTRLQSVVLPETYTSVDRPGLRWFGWRDDSGVLRCLLAAGNWRREVHLGSIGTHPQWRRRGLASTVTAAATRRGIAATGQVSLGLYADNDSARRVYEALGFALTHRVESRRPSS